MLKWLLLLMLTTVGFGWVSDSVAPKIKHCGAFKVQTEFVKDIHSVTHFAAGVVSYKVFEQVTDHPVLWSLGSAILWEIGDGFKPLWYEDPHNDWRNQVYRSDGFSWSDIVFHGAGIVAMKTFDQVVMVTDTKILVLWTF